MCQQVDENIYYARQNLSSNLLLTLQAAEKRRQEEKNEDTAEPPDVGFLTRKEFSEELVKYFGITHQEDMLFLLKVASQQLQTKGNIEYTKLFLLVMSTPTYCWYFCYKSLIECTSLLNLIQVEETMLMNSYPVSI